MVKYIGNLDKKQVDELMALTRRLGALLDLKSTVHHLENKKNPGFNLANLSVGSVESQIKTLMEKKKNILEAIRNRQGWSPEQMPRIQIMENYKAYYRE